MVPYFGVPCINHTSLPKVAVPVTEMAVPVAEVAVSLPAQELWHLAIGKSTCHRTSHRPKSSSHRDELPSGSFTSRRARRWPCQREGHALPNGVGIGVANGEPFDKMMQIELKPSALRRHLGGGTIR